MSQWLGSFDDRYQAPNDVSENTRAKKNRIVMDLELEESDKFILLCELCMKSKETFYVHVQDGCIRFRYASIYDIETVFVEYADEKIEKNTGYRHVYHFRLGEHERQKLNIKKTRFGRKLEYNKENLLKSRKEFIVPVNPDIPYDSLVCYQDLENFFGSSGFIGHVKYLYKEEEEKSLQKGSRTRRHFETNTSAFIDFEKKSNFLYMNYGIKGALDAGKLARIKDTVYKFNALSNKSTAFERLYCPDQNSGVSALAPRIDDLCKHHALYNSLNLVSDDFLLASDTEQFKMIASAYKRLKAANYTGTEYSYLYEQLKLMEQYKAEPEKAKAHYENIIENLYYKNIIDFFFEDLSFNRCRNVNSPMSLKNRAKDAPQSILDRNNVWRARILKEYGSLYKFAPAKEITMYEDELFKYLHHDPYNLPAPKDASEKLAEMNRLFTPEARRNEYDWRKKIYNRYELIKAYA